jgi:hypothetical protein
MKYLGEVRDKHWIKKRQYPLSTRILAVCFWKNSVNVQVILRIDIKDIRVLLFVSKLTAFFSDHQEECKIKLLSQLTVPIHSSVSIMKYLIY